MTTRDKNGQSVSVGSRVRMLAIPAGVIEGLDAMEVDLVKSMVGRVFVVEEIDEYGCAWVTKWWGAETESPEAHSLALTAEEMEVVEG